jgi:hypothetical protein
MQHPIRVRAKAGVLVPVPRLRGGVAQYVGRDIDHDAFKAGETDHEKLYPIRKDPDEFSIPTSGYDVYAEIKRCLREGDLLLEMKAAPAASPAPQSAGDASHTSDPARTSRSKA